MGRKKSEVQVVESKGKMGSGAEEISSDSEWPDAVK